MRASIHGTNGRHNRAPFGILHGPPDLEATCGQNEAHEIHAEHGPKTVRVDSGVQRGAYARGAVDAGAGGGGAVRDRGRRGGRRVHGRQPGAAAGVCGGAPGDRGGVPRREPGQRRGDSHGDRADDGGLGDHPGRGPGIRSRRIRGAAEAGATGDCGRGVRFAVRDGRIPAGAVLLAHIREQDIDAMHGPAHGAEPDGHGDVLQAGAGGHSEGPELAQRGIRHRAGTGGEAGAMGRADLRGADFVQRPDIRRRQEDRRA